MKRWIGGCAAVLGLIAQQPTHAAGYYFSDIGVRSFSRGGAFVASNNDMTALFYNPAALTRIKRNQFMLNVAGVQQSVRFQRSGGEGAGPLDENGVPTDIAFSEIENKAPAYVIPHFGISSRLGTKSTTFAFGFYPPYAPDLSYDADGPQRYSLIDVMVIQTSLGPSVAHQVNDWVSVGGGVAWGVLLAEQQLAISVPFQAPNGIRNTPDGQGGFSTEIITPANEDPINDVGFEFAASDWRAWSWNAALMIEPPSKEWALGLMVQPPVHFHAEGYMAADFSNHILYTEGFNLGGDPDQVIMSKTSRDDNVSLNISMPLILKSGFAVRPSTATEIEVSAIWQQWSSIKNITITDLNLEVDLNEQHENELIAPQLADDVMITDDVVLPANYQDAWSFRIGGEHEVTSAFTLRAGTFYETSAIPSTTQSVSLIDGKKIGYGLGCGYQPNANISVDIGITQSFLTPTTATDSEVKQISVNALSGEFMDGTTIGNGTYESSSLIFGAGMTYEFGPNG